MINKRLRLQFVWFIALLSLLLSCLSLSWWVNAHFHYGYAPFYEFYDIGEHIQTFAPQNDYILGLDKLNKTEHLSLFNQISAAVHNHGKGLAEIEFIREGQPVALLHRAEVIHLQDVANLIDTLNSAAIGVLLFTVALLLYLFAQKRKPRVKAQLLCLLLLVAFTTLMLFVIGPTKVFYQFHLWVFPEGHQWFFYYQESLMSTLMKAPDLFGGIAAAIVVGALLLFGLCMWLLAYLYRVFKFRY